MSEIKLNGLIDGKLELSTEEIEGLKKLKNHLKSTEKIFSQEESRNFLKLLEKELGNYFLTKEGGFSLADFRKRKFNDSQDLYELYADIANNLGYNPKTQEQINKDYANDINNIKLNFITSGGGLTKEEIRGLYDLNQVLKYSDKIPALDFELRKKFVSELEKDVSFYLTHSGTSDYFQDKVIGDKYELYNSIVIKLGLTPKTKEELEDKGINLEEILDGNGKLESQEINALSELLSRLSKGELERKYFTDEEITKLKDQLTKELSWYLSVGFIKIDTQLKELINTLGKDVYSIYEKLGSILGFNTEYKEKLVTNYINEKKGLIYDRQINDLDSKQKLISNLLINANLRDITEIGNFKKDLEQFKFPEHLDNDSYRYLLGRVYDEVKRRQGDLGDSSTASTETQAKFGTFLEFYDQIDKKHQFNSKDVYEVVSYIREFSELEKGNIDITKCDINNLPLVDDKDFAIFKLLLSYPKETNQLIHNMDKIELNIDKLIKSMKNVRIDSLKINGKSFDLSYSNKYISGHDLSRAEMFSTDPDYTEEKIRLFLQKSTLEGIFRDDFGYSLSNDILDSTKSIPNFNNFLESIKNTDDKVKKLSILSKYVNIDNNLIEIIKTQEEFKNMDYNFISKLISQKIFYGIDEKGLKYLDMVKKDPQNISKIESSYFGYESLLKGINLIYGEGSIESNKFIEISKDKSKKDIAKYKDNIDKRLTLLTDLLSITDEKEKLKTKETLNVCIDYAFNKIASDSNLSIYDYKRVFLNILESIDSAAYKKLKVYPNLDSVLLGIINSTAKKQTLERNNGIKSTVDKPNIKIGNIISEKDLNAIISKNINDYKKLNQKDDVNVVYKNILCDYFQSYVNYHKTNNITEEQKNILNQLLYEVNSIHFDYSKFDSIINELKSKGFNVSDLDDFVSKEFEIKKIIIIGFSKYLSDNVSQERIGQLIDQSQKIISTPILFSEYVRKSNELFSDTKSTQSFSSSSSTHDMKNSENSLPSKIEYIDGYKAKNPFYDKDKNDKSDETIEGNNKIDLNKKIILKYFESSGYKINQIIGNLDDITFKDKLGINLNQDLTKQDFEKITMSFGRLFISKIESKIDIYTKGDPIRKILEDTKNKLILNPVEGFRMFLEFIGKNDDVVYQLGLYDGGSFVERKLSIDTMENYIGILEYYNNRQKEINLLTLFM